MPSDNFFEDYRYNKLDDEKYQAVANGRNALTFEGFDTVKIVENDAVFQMELAPP